MNNSQEFSAQMKLVSKLMEGNQQYKYLTNGQRSAILQKRINKFFGANQQIDVQEQHFKPRIQPLYSEDTITSDDTLILFGIDFLNPLTLRTMFAINDPSFEYVYLDSSNCMLKYSSPMMARKAIKDNCKKASETSFKIEQESQQKNQHIHHQVEPDDPRISLPVPPKQWIELNPYFYRFFHKNEQFCPQAYIDYSRKLYVRFATSREKSINKLCQNNLDQLYEKCKIIWTMESQKHAQLKTIVLEKLSEFKKRKEQLKQSHFATTHYRSDENHSNADSRSNQWQNESMIMCDSPNELNHQNGYYHFSHHRDRRNSHERQNSRQSEDLGNLINDIQKINMNCEEDEAFEEIFKQLENLNFDNLHRSYIEIPYKLTMPNQIRLTIDRQKRFKYHQYVTKSKQMELKMKTFSQIDLTKE